MAEMLAMQQKMTGLVSRLKEVTPGSGCYLNEVRTSHSKYLF